MNRPQPQAAASRAISPGAAALLQAALTHFRADRAADAEALCRQALQDGPAHPVALHLLGVVVNHAGRYKEALQLIDEAIAAHGADPDPAMLVQRGLALIGLGRPDEAVATYDRALARHPGDADAWQHRGRALVMLRQIDAALASVRRPVLLEPDNAWNRLWLANVTLAAGHLREGFALHEWRWWVDGFPLLKRDFAQPFWEGEAFPGRTLLLYADQGLGDAIQFCRYATLAAGRGGRVVLEMPTALAPLAAGLPGVARVVAKGDPLPSFDLQCPLMSLPLLFDTTLETIPAAPHYLRADPARVAAWAPHLPHDGRPRVGLAWCGNRTHVYDRERSIPLARLLPLAGADLAFVGLQQGVRAADAPMLAAMPWLVNLGDAFADFADTAAVLAQLDLVVTVDTAVAHLAAALGRPTWILLPAAPDWRWLLDREDSPWYPTVRLFRQANQGDWDEVVGRVLAALAEWPRGTAG